MRVEPLLSRAARRALFLALSYALFATGCALDLTMAGGMAVPERRSDVERGTWSGDVRVTLVPGAAAEFGIWALDHMTLGAELQGRAAYQRGSYLSAGGSLGLSDATPFRTCYATLDAGGPFSWHSRVDGYYLGISAGYLWTLRPRSAITSVNRTFRAFDQRVQIGPLLRYRRQSVDLVRQMAGRDASHDFLLGVQLRMQLATDFL